jgi:multimeric flavodoxin WrbA
MERSWGMKVLAINGTYRPEGTTTQLTKEALEGAASVGAETEMIMLRDCNIQYCRNCLACYSDLESEIAPCPISDDVTMILEKIRDADGVIFSSPIHCGFVSGVMTVFSERAVWRTARPTGEALGLKGVPAPRLEGKSRAVATLVTAGGIPQKLRKFCDQATPWLRDTGGIMCNGLLVCDMYAGAIFTKEPVGDDWKKLYFLRKLTKEQLAEARCLGVKVAETIRDGKVKPYDIDSALGVLPNLAGRMLVHLSKVIETTKE